MLAGACLAKNSLHGLQSYFMWPMVWPSAVRRHQIRFSTATCAEDPSRSPQRITKELSWSAGVVLPKDIIKRNGVDGSCLAWTLFPFFSRSEKKQSSITCTCVCPSASLLQKTNPDPLLCQRKSTIALKSQVHHGMFMWHRTPQNPSTKDTKRCRRICHDFVMAPSLSPNLCCTPT